MKSQERLKQFVAIADLMKEITASLDASDIDYTFNAYMDDVTRELTEFRDKIKAGGASSLAKKDMFALTTIMTSVKYINSGFRYIFTKKTGGEHGHQKIN